MIVDASNDDHESMSSPFGAIRAVDAISGRGVWNFDLARVAAAILAFDKLHPMFRFE
ncbi:MAG: hypothetical protein ABI145_11995 [Steroidobacteraceae bacterium]